MPVGKSDMSKTEKSLSERIAARIKALESSKTPGKNHAAFLAVRNDVIAAMADGWSAKVIWETLHEEGKIPFKYDAFLGYVERLIVKSDPPAEKREAAPQGNSSQDRQNLKQDPRRPTKDSQASSSKRPMRGFTFDPTVDKETLI